MIIATDGPRSD